MDGVLIFLLSLMNFVAKLPNIENKLFYLSNVARLCNLLEERL